jgi:mono/diheme cytochrome c family protein
MREILRWTGRILTALLLVVVLAAVALHATSSYRLNQPHDVAVESVAVPADSAAVVRGRHISVTRGCGDCHGPNLAGSTAVEDPMIGALHASNLTPGGVGGTYSDLDWVRALRHGVALDGSPLVFMP